MNEEAARELVEFVGQLAKSVAVLSQGMKAVMKVVEEKDREIIGLRSRIESMEHDSLRGMKYISPSYIGGSGGGGGRRYEGIVGGSSGAIGWDGDWKLVGEWKP